MRLSPYQVLQYGTTSWKVIDIRHNTDVAFFSTRREARKHKWDLDHARADEAKPEAVQESAG